MLAFLKSLFSVDRRKECKPVQQERRKFSIKEADEHLYASVDRFNKTVIRKREDMLK